MSTTTSYAENLEGIEDTPSTRTPQRESVARSSAVEESVGRKSATGLASVCPIHRNVPRIDGVVVGRLVATNAGEIQMVDYPGNPVGSPIPAIAASSPGSPDAGQEVALMFEGGDPLRPIVIGPVVRPDQSAQTATRAPQARGLSVSADGEQLTLRADKEIVLRCGDASITLTRTGKILLRGTYVVSRSSGVNRIKGGSVQIN